MIRSVSQSDNLLVSARKPSTLDQLKIEVMKLYKDRQSTNTMNPRIVILLRTAAKVILPRTGRAEGQH